MKVLILDNYDSFTFNLYQYLGEIDERPLVFRNDKITVAEIARLRPDRIILSPGPGNPQDAAYFGVCREVILELGPSVPMLGVCLGHQGICAAFGGRIVRAPQVMHGKSSLIFHDSSDLFAGLPQPFEAMRYHSLVAELSSLPDCIAVTARTSDELIMAVKHKIHPIYGVQFHPESIGTPQGRRLVANFIFVNELERVSEAKSA